MQKEVLILLERLVVAVEGLSDRMSISLSNINTNVSYLVADKRHAGVSHLPVSSNTIDHTRKVITDHQTAISVDDHLADFENDDSFSSGDEDEIHVCSKPSEAENERHLSVENSIINTHELVEPIKTEEQGVNEMNKLSNAISIARNRFQPIIKEEEIDVEDISSLTSEISVENFEPASEADEEFIAEITNLQTVGYVKNSSNSFGCSSNTSKISSSNITLREDSQQTLRIAHDPKDKKWAIAALKFGDEDNDGDIDVCVVARCWVSDDGSECLYPTYLPPKSQEQAAEECKEPSDQFGKYPVKVQRWFSSFEEARQRLPNTVKHTNMERIEAQPDREGRPHRKRKLPARFSESYKWEDEVQGDEKDLKTTRTKKKTKTKALPSLAYAGTSMEVIHNRNNLRSQDTSASNFRIERNFSYGSTLDATTLKAQTMDLVCAIDHSTPSSNSTIKKSVPTHLDVPQKLSANFGDSDLSQVCDVSEVTSVTCQPTVIHWEYPESLEVDGLTQEEEGHRETSNAEVNCNTNDAWKKNSISAQLQNMQAIMGLHFEKTKKVEKEVQFLRTTVEEIRQLLLSRMDSFNHPTDFPKLPLSSFADAEVAEEMATKKQDIKNYIVQKLSFAGRGQSDNECAKKVMALLFTNHTGTFFNWKGQNGKKAFQGWTLQDAVYLAVKSLRPAMDTKETSAGIKEWLKSRKFVNHYPN